MAEGRTAAHNMAEGNTVRSGGLTRQEPKASKAAVAKAQQAIAPKNGATEVAATVAGEEVAKVAESRTAPAIPATRLPHLPHLRPRLLYN